MYDDLVARVPGGESRELPRNSSTRLRGHYHGRTTSSPTAASPARPPDSRAAPKNAPIVNSTRPVSSSVGQPTHLAPTAWAAEQWRPRPRAGAAESTLDAHETALGSMSRDAQLARLNELTPGERAASPCTARSATALRAAA
jgi:hypothetical protein